MRSTALLNQALLGKLAWKILVERRSLASEFFLSKYYHSQFSFLGETRFFCFMGLAEYFEGKGFDRTWNEMAVLGDGEQLNLDDDWNPGISKRFQTH